MVYHCTGCKSFSTNPLGKCLQNGNNRVYKVNTGPTVNSTCNICGSKYHVSSEIIVFDKKYV